MLDTEIICGVQYETLIYNMSKGAASLGPCQMVEFPNLKGELHCVWLQAYRHAQKCDMLPLVFHREKILCVCEVPLNIYGIIANII